MVSLDMMKPGDKNYTEVLIAPVHRLKDIVADIVIPTGGQDSKSLKIHKIMLGLLINVPEFEHKLF